MPWYNTMPFCFMHFSDSFQLHLYHYSFLVPVDAGCGGTFTDESGILISPNYPNPYNHNAQCVWTVTVNPLDKIKLTFTNLELEGHLNCQYDYVEVRCWLNMLMISMGQM